MGTLTEKSSRLSQSNLIFTFTFHLLRWAFTKIKNQLIIGPQINIRHNHNIAPIRTVSRVVFLQVLVIPIPDHHPFRHLGSLDENLIVKNCSTYEIISESTFKQVIFKAKPHTYQSIFKLTTREIAPLGLGPSYDFTNMKIWCLMDMVQIRGIRTNDYNAFA